MRVRRLSLDPNDVVVKAPSVPAGSGSAIWAWAEAKTGRGGDSEFFERFDCPISCSFVISRAICSWPAVSWSTLRVICF
jgi:hypothetical protein